MKAELALTEPGVTGDSKILLDSAINNSFKKVNAIAAAAGAPKISTVNIRNYINAVMTKYDAKNPVFFE